MIIIITIIIIIIITITITTTTMTMMMMMMMMKFILKFPIAVAWDIFNYLIIRKRQMNILVWITVGKQQTDRQAITGTYASNRNFTSEMMKHFENINEKNGYLLMSSTVTSPMTGTTIFGPLALPFRTTMCSSASSISGRSSSAVHLWLKKYQYSVS